MDVKRPKLLHLDLDHEMWQLIDIGLRLIPVISVEPVFNHLLHESHRDTVVFAAFAFSESGREPRKLQFLMQVLQFILAYMNLSSRISSCVDGCHDSV